MKYPKYTDTKDTEVSWIGDLPVSWELKRLNYLFTFKKRPVKEKLGVVTAFRDGQVTLRSKRRIDGFTEADKEIGYQTVHAGDLVIHAMDAFAGAIGVSDSEGKCSPVCSVCEPRAGVNSHFYGYVMRHVALSGYITSLAKGIRERSTDFRWSDARLLRLPVPPNQAQIVAFLKRETAKIDKLITKQKKLIKLLQEKRQAVISQAVTKGLDPNVKMKDSGVEWLGEVPEHWTAGSLRWYVNIRSGDFIANTEFDTNQLRPCEVIGGNGVSGYTEKFNVSKAIVVGRVGALCGNVHILSKPSWVTDNALILEFSNKLHDDYAAEYLRCLDLNKLANKNAQPLITGSMIKSQRCLIPPLSEQRLISRKVDQTYHQFGYLAERAEDSIRLLKEHRQALITAAVTGKIDVRGLVTDEDVAALDQEPDETAFSDEEITDLDKESADDELTG